MPLFGKKVFSNERGRRLTMTAEEYAKDSLCPTCAKYHRDLARLCKHLHAQKDSLCGECIKVYLHSTKQTEMQVPPEEMLCYNIFNSVCHECPPDLARFCNEHTEIPGCVRHIIAYQNMLDHLDEPL